MIGCWMSSACSSAPRWLILIAGPDPLGGAAHGADMGCDEQRRLGDASRFPPADFPHMTGFCADPAVVERLPSLAHYADGVVAKGTFAVRGVLVLGAWR